MNTRIKLLIACLICTVGVFAQGNDDISTKAKKLKDNGNYLEASRSFQEYRSMGNLKGKQLLDAMMTISNWIR